MEAERNAKTTNVSRVSPCSAFHLTAAPFSRLASPPGSSTSRFLIRSNRDRILEGILGERFVNRIGLAGLENKERKPWKDLTNDWKMLLTGESGRDSVVTSWSSRKKSDSD